MSGSPAQKILTTLAMIGAGAPTAATWTCIANACDQHTESWSEWAEAVAAMRAHVQAVAHDPRWPVTFRTSIGVHYEPSASATPGATA